MMRLNINLSHDYTYILSVSGGVDSMCLFHYLNDHKYRFVAVYFDHQKRADSVNDHQLIASLCEHHKIPYYYIKLSIKGGNFQARSRALRHHHLKEIAGNWQTKYILTAHHLDDLSETILMKILRGSSLLGYSGMQEKTQTKDGFCFIKPLLYHLKKDLYTYAKEHQVPFLEDISNQSDDYLRNRIRHHIMPILKDESENLDSFINYHKQLSLAHTFLRSETIKVLSENNTFSMKDYQLLDEAVQFDLIAYLFEQFEAPKNYKKLYSIRKQLLSEKPNISIRILKDIYLIKAYDTVSVSFSSNDLKTSNLPDLMISHKALDAPYNAIELCYNELDFPLKLRFRKPGDLLSFDYGHKKLKSYLIDQKIPLKVRDSLIIITDANDTILWIPSLYVNQTLGKKHTIYIALKENKHASRY